MVGWWGGGGGGGGGGGVEWSGAEWSGVQWSLDDLGFASDLKFLGIAE